MKLELFNYKSNDYSIVIGQNKNDNFEIIDAANETDIWFHVQGESSCHIILKNTGSVKEIPKQVVKRCAYLCKINSKAKTQSQCSVMYTPVNNVTKTKIIGQVTVNTYKLVNV
jgi:predicted ribosome quality control (RQC) complex YloA/Tae2 family protein